MKANGGTSGVDGETCEQVEARGLTDYLAELRLEMEGRRYQLVLEPVFEADFSASSYGFRPRKSAQDAARGIYKYLNWGCVEVYDVDLEKYFMSSNSGWAVDTSKTVSIDRARRERPRVGYYIYGHLDLFCDYRVCRL